MKSLFSVLVAVAVIAGCSQDDGMLTAADVSVDGTSVELSSSSVSDARFSAGGNAEYEVTIINMSHSQPFSPGVLVTHDASASLFSGGSAASEGIRLIAENGDPSTAAMALGGADGVSDVEATMAPVHRKGGPGPDKLTAYITASDGARYLSLAAMLICTNDGFIGLDSVELPKGPETAVYFPGAYDAGTEANDELYTSVVDPCGGIGPIAVAPDGQNNRTATSDVVASHPGFTGAGDLDADAYNWRNKVARVTVKRVR
ncbi:MAG: hypothetical protein HKN13_12370 [Rhodothermales bacterium]|nr:hypothetical protein [Rhodothermales bacterium]